MHTAGYLGDGIHGRAEIEPKRTILYAHCQEPGPSSPANGIKGYMTGGTSPISGGGGGSGCGNGSLSSSRTTAAANVDTIGAAIMPRSDIGDKASFDSNVSRLFRVSLFMSSYPM